MLRLAFLIAMSGGWALRVYDERRSRRQPVRVWLVLWTIGREPVISRMIPTVMTAWVGRAVLKGALPGSLPLGSRHEEGSPPPLSLVPGQIRICPPGQCVGPLLAGGTDACIFERNSDAMNLGARCRAVRPCLEGSKSRDRLSGTPTPPVHFLCSGRDAKRVTVLVKCGIWLGTIASQGHQDGY